MSILSLPFAPRRRASDRGRSQAVAAAWDTDRAAGAKTLANLVPGQRAAVVDIDATGDPAAARRLFDLGFVPGAEVQMVRRAPLADPVVFRVAGYDIALRREQARWVTVSASAS